MMGNGLKWVKDRETIYAIIIREDFNPSSTTFLTPETFIQQIGFIVYGKGELISPHKHKKVERTIQGTNETILVRKGKVEVSIYNDEGKLFFKDILDRGDMIAMISGGHAFKMLEDTVLVEVKQGPYLGDDDKLLLNEGA